MKTRFGYWAILLFLVFFVRSVRGGTVPISPDDLPGMVYLLNEPREGLKPGQQGIFSIARNGVSYIPIFESSKKADAFLDKVEPAKAKVIALFPVPRSFVTSLLQSGGGVILDPESPSDGGSFVTLAAAGSGFRKDNEELAKLKAEDQDDRTGWDKGRLDWTKVGPRDESRKKRVKEMVAHNELKTGTDYFNAALVLQHGTEPNDYLLAHELAIVAASKSAEGAL